MFGLSSRNGFVALWTAQGHHWAMTSSAGRCFGATRKMEALFLKEQKWLAAVLVRRTTGLRPEFSGSSSETLFGVEPWVVLAWGSLCR